MAGAGPWTDIQAGLGKILCHGYPASSEDEPIPAQNCVQLNRGQ